MINNIILLLAAIIATIHYFARRKTMCAAEVVNLYLIYFLFSGVGLIGGIGFVAHVFYPNQTAAMIGWPPGSPFQFEVGLHDGAWGLLGFLCFFLRGNFWTATVIGWSFFMIGAAYGHIHDAYVAGNFAPYNVGSILPDLLVPIILLSLLVMRYRYAK